MGAALGFPPPPFSCNGPLLSPRLKIDMGRRLRSVFHFIAGTVLEWFRVQPHLLAAGLSFFALLSLPPLAVLLIVALQNRISPQDIVASLTQLLNRRAALALWQWVEASQAGPRTLSALSVLLLFFSASRLFAQLQTSLDIAFRAVVPHRAFWRRFLARRVLMPLLLIAALLLVAGLFGATDSVISLIAGGTLRPSASWRQAPWWRPARFAASLIMLSAVVAALFRWVPHVRIGWRAVGPGACLSALALLGARALLTEYLQPRAFGSLYGAIGAVVILMLWTYLAFHVLLFGAVFTRRLAEARRASVRQASEGERLDKNLELPDR